MKKDIEWLKGKINAFQEGENMFTAEFNAGVQDALEYVQELISQLDEPEVLSPEWIDKNKFEVNGWNEAVHVEDLQNLLVPTLSEMETVEITEEPETVAGVIADFFKSLERLKEVMSMEVEELEE